jgi:enoyl-CoA hydratase/carnithine racemase
VTAADDPVLLDRSPGPAGDVFTVTLNHPERHNALSAQLRDALIEALEVPAVDPSISEVVLRGAGRTFSSGGHLDEFGSATDPAASHILRPSRSAGLAVHRMRERVRAVVHRGCIGAGIAVPSFAGRLEAMPNAWFRLPDLDLGLIPGAGVPSASPRRIGQWRTAWMVLSGDRVNAPTALEWGLVDAIVEEPAGD